MFGFNKKNKPDFERAADTHYRPMWYAVKDERDRLEKCVEKVIVCNGVVDLYPDGPDKKTAEYDAKQARHLLLCAIGAYDCRRNELREWYKANKNDLCALANWDAMRWPESHRLIEDFYKNFFKKRA